MSYFKFMLKNSKFLKVIFLTIFGKLRDIALKLNVDHGQF